MKNWFELKYSLRVLRKSLGHTAMCVTIVALSLCVGMIALTLVYNLTLKPLDYKDGERWVHLTHFNNQNGVKGSGDSIDSFYYQYLKNNNTIFESLGAFRAFSESRMNFGETDTRVSSAEITPHIFAAAGMHAYLGRTPPGVINIANIFISRVIEHVSWNHCDFRSGHNDYCSFPGANTQSLEI